MSPETISSSSQRQKPQRVLACVLCQQRKVKCDRKFPCVNCVKSQSQCVPATLAQRKPRRKFLKRALLERLRKYEDLLRQNNIAFDPLHKDSATRKESLNEESIYDSDEEVPATPSISVKSERDYEIKNIWHAMSQGFRDPGNDSDSSLDDVRETVVKNAWDQSIDKNDDNLLFGSRGASVDLSTLHPDPVQIFRLWQIYLDNVNPLLKVIHTPSLQGRIIEAASNVTNINPTLEVLMFSIYCTSTLSLDIQDCQTMFGSSKEDLLTRYQFGCQQALLNCGFLRTDNRDCLTALFLYLISVRNSTAPQSLSSLLGVATRTAHRMGIHNESLLSKCSPLEAEMRRRLWWSLVLFDSRMSEICYTTTVTLDPTWDCKVPLNVSDSDLRLEMKVPPIPATRGTSTEALFAVVRGEIGDFVRNSSFYLDFSTPALKPIAKYIQDNSGDNQIDLLEKRLESQYLSTCDQDNPLHFMTLWSTRATIAKCRLLDHHCRHSSSKRSETQHDIATSYALAMLEADTQIMSSPLTKGFRWLNHSYFPFPAYLQTVQDLRRRPKSDFAPRAWEVMSDNYDAWLHGQVRDESPFFKIFAGIVEQAWKACEEAAVGVSSTPPPRIVTSIRELLGTMPKNSNASGEASQVDEIAMAIDMNLGVDDFSTSEMGFLDQKLPYTMPTQAGYEGIFTGDSMPSQSSLDAHMMNQIDWNMFMGRQPGW